MNIFLKKLPYYWIERGNIQEWGGICNQFVCENGTGQLLELYLLETKVRFGFPLNILISPSIKKINNNNNCSNS